MVADFWRWISVAIAVLLLAGCSGGTVPVTGKVTLSDGTPVVDAIVRFENAEDQLGSSGTTDADGVYQLTTHTVNDGVPPGSYIITVHQPYPGDSAEAQGPRVFHPKYENPNTSGLTFDVDWSNREFDIKLDKP